LQKKWRPEITNLAKRGGTEAGQYFCNYGIKRRKYQNSCFSKDFSKEMREKYTAIPTFLLFLCIKIVRRVVKVVYTKLDSWQNFF
jgi:hypothetical protein